MKRKIVSALLVMSMTASLVACGNSGSGSSDPADESVSVSSSASSESDASASASSESEAEAEESEMPEGYDETSTELYNEALGDFNDALATAKEAETVDERYALMAVAEGKLMESAMMYPLTSRGGTYAMYRMAPRTKDYTLWGSDNDRYHQYVVTTDFIKAEDYNEMRARWDELKGTGTYESWVKVLKLVNCSRKKLIKDILKMDLPEYQEKRHSYNLQMDRQQCTSTDVGKSPIWIRKRMLQKQKILVVS